MATKSWSIESESPGADGWRGWLSYRLKKEGRWLEAEQRLNALKNSGVGSDEAWRTVYGEYPPLGADTGEVAGSEAVPREDPPVEAKKTPAIPDGAPSRGRKRRDFKRDVQWVYDHFEGLRQKQIPVHKAPSSGAWSLGQRAIENPQWFFKELCVKFFKEEEKDGEGRFDDERDQFRLLDIFEREETESRARKAEELELGEVGAET